MHDLKLPKEINVREKLGQGRRSEVYLANYLEHEVVVKVYKQAYIEKYQNQYKVNIGEFEYERNKIAYNLTKIHSYIAKPYKLLRPSEGYDLALVQERVNGTWLLDLIKQLHGLPDEVLEIGYLIVQQAAKMGLYDLDISPGNIQIIQTKSGQWHPKLYDFNLMPQHMQPPNPFMRLGFALGLRSKNHRDYRSLKQWKKIGQLATAQH